MISLIITLLIMLVVVGLLLWATSLLSGLGIPHQVVIAVQILIILVAVLYLLQLSGVFGTWRWP